MIYYMDIPSQNAADFFSELQPVKDWQQAPAPVQQVPQINQQPIQQPTPPQWLSPEDLQKLEAEVESELQKQIQVNQNVDNLLEELLQTTPQENWQTQNVQVPLVKENEIVTENSNEHPTDDSDELLSPEEQTELVDLLEEIKEESELGKIEMQSQIEQLTFKNDLLKNEVLKYAEKAVSLEREANIAPKVPDELDKFLYYFQNSKEKQDKLSNEQMRWEFLRLAERFFKRKLDDYVSDVYTYWWDEMPWWGWGWMSQYDIRGMVPQNKQKTESQTVVDMMMDRF